MRNHDRTTPIHPRLCSGRVQGPILKRLRRIVGSARIQVMVEDDRYCIDVLHNHGGAGRFDKVAWSGDDHTRHCILGADHGTREARHAELMTALGRMVGRR